MTADVFQEVPEENISTVLKELKMGKDWPNNFVLHQLVEVLGVYKKADTKFKHKLYLYGNIENGVFLNKLSIQLPDGDKDTFYIYTGAEDLSALHNSLSETRVVPWAMPGFQFIMVHARFYPIVREVFDAKGVQFQPVPNNMLWLPPAVDLLSKELPEDIYLDFLKESHAAQVDANWAHRFPGSELIMRENILRNFGLGLFRKSDNIMVSSALSNFTGGIVMLHSDPEFRGRGYAGTIVEQMVREIRRRGWIPYCTVVLGNEPSEKLFRKYQFERFTASTWMISKSVGKTSANISQIH